jgi:Holliday junction resolvasome RuvABC endonuclease subunit
MEDTKPSIVIAVAPGTRSLGVAVFKGLELIYYAVKEASKHRLKHTPHSRAREAVRAVEQVIHKHQPDHFVTLNPHGFQSLSAKLPIITEEVRRFARHSKLTFHEYQRAEIRQHLCPSGRVTRQAVAAHLSVLYPELSRHVKGVSLWQWLYYARMFDAVAAGYFRASELQRERERLQLAYLDERALSINTDTYETATRP